MTGPHDDHGSLSISPVSQPSPVSIASSHKRFASSSGTVASPSCIRRVKSLSLDGRLKEEVSTIEGIFRDVRLTLCTSPVPGDDSEEEETHLDFSKTTGDVSAEPDVFLPFVHYTMDEWLHAHDGTKASYWRITKRANREFLQERMTVVTSKQIREEDKRHLERLKSEHSWKQRVAFLEKNGGRLRSILNNTEPNASVEAKYRTPPLPPRERARCLSRES